MIYILNNNLKDSQKIRNALQNIFGIGFFFSNQICDQLGFSQNLRDRKNAHCWIECSVCPK